MIPRDRTKPTSAGFPGQLQRKLKRHSEWASTVTFSPNHARVVGGNVDKAVRVWDAAAGRLLQELKRHSGTARPRARTVSV